MKINEITARIIQCAMNVHTELGAGLLERVYHTCLLYELRKKELLVESEVELPIIYNNIKLDRGFQLDLLVENAVIVELKSIREIAAVHSAQMLTYLKLSKKEFGLLINFNVPHLRNGIRRFVQNDFSSVSSVSSVVNLTNPWRLDD